MEEKLGLLITLWKFKEKLYPLSKCIQSVVLRGVASERGEVDHKQHLEVVSSGGDRDGLTLLVYSGSEKETFFIFSMSSVVKSFKLLN